MMNQIGRNYNVSNINIIIQTSCNSCVDHNLCLKVIDQDLCTDSCINFSDAGLYNNYFFPSRIPE